MGAIGAARPGAARPGALRATPGAAAPGRTVAGGARWRVVGGALALALAACGVRPEAQPSRLDRSVVPAETPVPRPVVAEVWFVSGARLVAIRRPVVAPGRPEQRLAALLAGPGVPSRLTTALDAGVSVSMRAGVATVALPASFVRTPRDEQRLAAGQLVLTLTGSPDVAVVRFTAAGRQVAVPTADGEPTSAPVTRADYAALTS